MGFVVVREDDFLLEPAVHGFTNLLGQVQFRFQPKRHGHQKRTQPLRRERQIRFEEALEFQQRLVVDDDIVQVFRLEIGFLETVFDGVFWEVMVVLLTREALLLHGGD